MQHVEFPKKKELLEDCLLTFSETAIESARSIFQMEFHTKEPWTMIDRIPGNFEHNISMGNGNDHFQGIMTVGIDTKSLSMLIESQAPDDVVDAFGELLNIFCGLLMDNKEITRRFGFLVQSVPLYAENNAFYPNAWSCIGNICSENGSSMQLGIALRPRAVTA